jgi:predicted hydrocarbon binding protein
MGNSQSDEDIQKIKDQNWRLEWRFNHARSQFYKYIELTLPLLAVDDKKIVFQQLGRNCANSLGWAQKYIGNPEGFFQFMKEHSGETIYFNEERNKITVETAQRACDCPIMKDKCIDGIYCECSIGWQKQTYEIILNKKVSVTIKEAVFRGSTRCVFEISIQ